MIESAKKEYRTLSKVKGFDYVPENLRSDAFLKAAVAIVEKERKNAREET